MYFCVVLCIVCFVMFTVLFVCICVLNYCRRVATQLQLNISYHTLSQIFSALTLSWFMLGLTVVANHVFCMLLVHLKCCMEIWCCGFSHQVTRLSQLVQQNVFLKIILQCSHFRYYS
jgi:hypothetical protein